MKQSVIMLLGFLIIISISGCAPKIEYIKVPQKCTIPHTEEPIIDNASKDNILESSKQCLRNYLKMKQYAETLKANSKVCQ